MAMIAFLMRFLRRQRQSRPAYGRQGEAAIAAFQGMVKMFALCR
ncbi:hypothetical protein [Ancylobacter aquaticus]|nr:hypothetical protein [Ancylobacter aquaticus]